MQFNTQILSLLALVSSIQGAPFPSPQSWGSLVKAGSMKSPFEAAASLRSPFTEAAGDFGSHASPFARAGSGLGGLSEVTSSGSKLAQFENSGVLRSIEFPGAGLSSGAATKLDSIASKEFAKTVTLGKQISTTGRAGRVFEATHPIYGKIAVKEFYPASGQDMIIKEFEVNKALGRLKGPLYKCGNNFCLPMELYQGKNLSEELAKLSPKSKEWETLYVQARKEVQVLHQKGWIHGDAHGNNFIVATDAAGKKTVHIIDFGFAEKLVPGKTSELAIVDDFNHILKTPR